MSAVDHEAAVARLLADLGDTADAVADRLRALGIKGRRASACGCPIALYVKKAGWGTPAVASDLVVDNPDDDFRTLRVPLTPAVDLFRSRFDAGVYLDLVEVAGD